MKALSHTKQISFFACVFFLATAFVFATGGQSRYDSLIRSIAAKYSLSASLVHAMIKAESNYNPYAVSSKGAKGLMQLMPETVLDYGVDNPYDPEKNIEAGIKHLKNFLSSYDGDLKLALAAYNAGPEAVKKYNGVPPFPETQRYIKKIQAAFKGNPRNLKKTIYTYYNASGRLVITNNPHLRKSDQRRLFMR